MPWYQILGLGVSGGILVGLFFFTLGWVLDKRQERRWKRAMARATAAFPSRNSSEAVHATAEALEKFRKGLIQDLPRQRQGEHDQDGDDARG